MQAPAFALARFQREAMLLQTLRHPNVIEFFGSSLDVQPVRLTTSTNRALFLDVLKACLRVKSFLVT